MALRSAKFSLVPTIAGSTELFLMHQASFMIGIEVSSDSRIGSGPLVSISTVMSSMRRTSLTDPTTSDSCELLEVMRLKENATSPAVSGLPSSHFTPGRRWKVHSTGLVCSHFTASAGSTSSFLLRRTSGS